MQCIRCGNMCTASLFACATCTGVSYSCSFGQRSLGSSLGPQNATRQGAHRMLATKTVPLPQCSSHMLLSAVSPIFPAGQSISASTKIPLCAQVCRSREPINSYAYCATSSKFSTRSGTSSSSPSSSATGSAPGFCWYDSAIFFRFCRLSGPSWLMMPGKRSWRFLVSA